MRKIMGACTGALILAACQGSICPTQILHLDFDNKQPEEMCQQLQYAEDHILKAAHPDWKFKHDTKIHVNPDTWTSKIATPGGATSATIAGQSFCPEQRVIITNFSSTSIKTLHDTALPHELLHIKDDCESVVMNVDPKHLYPDSPAACDDVLEYDGPGAVGYLDQHPKWCSRGYYDFIDAVRGGQ